MVARVEIDPQVLTWAAERSRRSADDLLKAVPELESWTSGAKKPTLRQLEKFARATYTPVGFLFLQEPPAESLPIPDFRTIGDETLGSPSPGLLDTIYLCEQRQEWYADYSRSQDLDVVDLVGSADIGSNVISVAASMRDALGFTLEERLSFSNWSDALRRLIDLAERVGVLVMVSGIVGNNTHRKLDPQEFRGFALVDERAPLIFLNGADTKAAQIFTFAHELAHIWSGTTGVDKPDLNRNRNAGSVDVERWCNEVAAEFLVPINELPQKLPGGTLTETLQVLAKQFRVSTLVILRRLYDAKHLSWEDFRAAYDDELDRVMSLAEVKSPGGGDFYNTQPLRVSRRFARAIIANTLEGGTGYSDAFQLLGVRSTETFRQFGERVGVE